MSGETAAVRQSSTKTAARSNSPRQIKQKRLEPIRNGEKTAEKERSEQGKEGKKRNVTQEARRTKLQSAM